MPIYNNQALGQSFENIARMFTPASGSDLQGYSAAALNRQKEAQLAQLFAAGASPSEQSALIGIQNYGQTPQGFTYQTDQNNATQRYGYDTQATTSRTNNAADNDRALMEAVIGAATDPVAQGAIRPGFNPADFGVNAPAVPQFAGSTAPLSETQWQAAQNDRLLQAGTLTDDMLMQAFLGDQTPVKALGPDGKPVFMSPGAAVQSGATPAPSDSGMSLKTNPDGTIEYSTGSKVGNPTEMTDRAGMFYNRAAPASSSIDAAIKDGYVPSDADYEGSLGALNGLPNAATRHLISEKGRAFYNNSMNFMMAVLRPDTGAAFGEEEFQNYARVFIPMPGDTEDIIRQKSEARAIALAALRGTSRGADERIAAILQAQGLPVPPEMQAVLNRGGIPGAVDPSPTDAGDMRGPPSAPTAPVAPPEGAINALRADPSLAEQFDAKYGAGTAAQILGR